MKNDIKKLPNAKMATRDKIEGSACGMRMIHTYIDHTKWMIDYRNIIYVFVGSCNCELFLHSTFDSWYYVLNARAYRKYEIKFRIMPTLCISRRRRRRSRFLSFTLILGSTVFRPWIYYLFWKYSRISHFCMHLYTRGHWLMQ